jgi:hypothetical protein
MIASREANSAWRAASCQNTGREEEGEEEDSEG